jgi:hypothetical protein
LDDQGHYEANDIMRDGRPVSVIFMFMVDIRFIKSRGRAWDGDIKFPRLFKFDPEMIECLSSN